MLGKALRHGRHTVAAEPADNAAALAARRTSPRVHNPAVQAAARQISAILAPAPEQLRSAPPKQARLLKLPAFPITTIDSFPQTAEIRQARGEFKAGHLDFAHYQGAMHAEIDRCVQEQEALGLDVLVHGEAEYDARSASVFNCFYAHKNKKATRKGGLSC